MEPEEPAKKDSDLDLEHLISKFLDCCIETQFYLPRNRFKRSDKTLKEAETIFNLILKRKKDDISTRLKDNGISDFMLFLEHKERYPCLNPLELDALLHTLNKDMAYNFLIGYGLLLKEKKRYGLTVEVGEKALNLAQQNGDLVCLGENKKVLKIKTSSNKKTVIFKKEYQNLEDLRLEHAVWQYYEWLSLKLLCLNTVTYDKQHKQRYYFNLPEKIAYVSGALEENATYLIWRADSEDLLTTIFESNKKTKKEITKCYLQEIAKLNAFGPFNLVPAQKYLTTKEAFLNRMERIINKKIKPDLTKKVMGSYETVAKILGESKVNGIVKDATFKNATYADKKIIPIDYNKLRIAPLQVDLSKLLILSYRERHECLKEFIKEYNSAVNFFNKNFTNKQFYFPYYKACRKEPERQEIKNYDEFYFVFLNAVIDNSLVSLFGDVYKDSMRWQEINSIQKYNALAAIRELRIKYEPRYSQEDLKKLESLSDIFKDDPSYCGLSFTI